MTLEIRGLRVYFYRSVRTGRRVLKQYVSAGALAHLDADEAREEREQREREREAQAARRAELVAVGDALDEHLTLARTRAAQLFKRLGFHEHRGQWRRKR